MAIMVPDNLAILLVYCEMFGFFCCWSKGDVEPLSTLQILDVEE